MGILRLGHEKVRNEKARARREGWVKARNFLGKRFEDVHKHYEFGEIIRRFQFGWTSKVTCLQTGEKFACKSILKYDLELPSHVGAVQREVAVLNHLQGYDGIAKLERVFEDRESIHIVRQLCEGDDLFVNVTYGGHYSEQEAANAIRAILETVANMHSMHVIHRGVTPESFLLHKKDRGSKLKAVELGLCGFFRGNETFTDVHGSACYLAPEALRGKYTCRADIWSCGVVLFFLLCGKPPFSGLTQERVRFHVLYGIPSYLHLSRLGVSPGAKRCIRKMLQKNPRKRPSAREMLQDEWIIENCTSSSQPLDNALVKRLKRFSTMNGFEKEVLRFIALNLPEIEIEGLRTIFCGIDTNIKGRVTLNELKEGVEGLGGVLSESQLQQIMYSGGVDDKGGIDYEEYLAATIHMSKARAEETLLEAFEYFDKDGDGYITIKELKSALECREDICRVHEIMKQMDGDEDGRINFADFKRVMHMGGGGVQTSVQHSFL